MTTFELHQGAQPRAIVRVPVRLVALLVAAWLAALLLITVSVGPAPSVGGLEPANCPAEDLPQPGHGLDL